MVRTSAIKELKEHNCMAALVGLIVINRGVFRTLSNISDEDLWENNNFAKKLFTYIWQGPK